MKQKTPDITRNVLITGCSSGIGYHCARELSKRPGYRVFASARKPEDVERLNAEGLEAVQLDLADEKSVDDAFADIMQRSGNRLYGLFNNGAYGQPGAVEDLSRAVLREQFETNVFGTHQLTALAIRVMRQQGGYGRIVQDSSVLGFVALAMRGAYNASKYALEGLSDTLRLELADTDIRVSLIEPGPIESQFRHNAFLMYKQNINPETSVHRDKYLATEARLTKEGPAVPFTLPPDAVYKKLLHALESRNPKPRYYVTFPTYLFGYLKRMLSTRKLDAVLSRTG